jgi:hypothetical protein
MVTATIKPASGTAAPTGTVTFTLGTVTLGTGTLTASGSSATASATATITVNGSQLATGANTIKASYAGTTAFGASSGTTSVTITGTTPNSSVTVSITPNPVIEQHRAWTFTVLLSNAGGATTLTNFTVNGTSYAGQIRSFFGSTSIPANGKLSANLQMTNVPVPVSVVFGFSGTDANGNTWTQSATVPFQ